MRLKPVKSSMCWRPLAGTLRRMLAREGETLQVGAVLATAADASVSDAELDEFVAPGDGETRSPARRLPRRT